MSTLRTTTAANLASLGSTSNAGDTYFETDNNRIVVWSGSGWTLYNYDAIFAPFANAYSVSFDGTNDYLSNSDSGPLYNWGANDHSISAWVKPDTVAISGGQTNPYQSRSIVSRANVYFALYLTRDGYPALYWFAGGIKTLIATSTVSTTAWTHIVATWNANGCDIYVNGTLENSNATQSPADASSNDSSFFIGKHSIGTQDYYGGLIDEVAVFGNELSSTQVSDIYAGSRDLSTYATDNSLNLDNWWRMGDSDSGTGTTVTDLGSEGYDLSLNNGPIFSTDAPS